VTLSSCLLREGKGTGAHCLLHGLKEPILMHIRMWGSLVVMNGLSGGRRKYRGWTVLDSR
jgi:hypothetical protein